MRYTYVKGQGIVDGPKKKAIKRYVGNVLSSVKLVGQAAKAIVTEPFTNRILKAQNKVMQDNPPASPRYTKKAWVY